jgi:transposase
MNGRGELTDRQFKRLEAFLPPQKPRTGRPAEDHRRIINGILWILRTGAPWRDLPEKYGPWPTVYSRFYRWRKAGIWDRIFAALQAQGAIDWEVHFVDSTIIRAHQHAAGAKKGTQPQKLLVIARGDSAPRYTSEQKAGASR